MKIKFNSYNDFHLGKPLKFHMLIVRSVFQEVDKYYLQVFLDACLYEL